MHRFGAEIASDRASVQAFVDERRQAYRDAADSIKSLLGRDLTRITDKFATSYVAGCLAIRYHVLPFTEAEILAALLTCERDHVAFIDRELGAAEPTRFISAPGAPIAVVEDTALAGVPAAALVPVPTSFDRLRRFINRNRKRGFIDLRAPGLTRQRFRFKLLVLQTKHAPLLGYVAAGEYWIPGPVFEQVAGSAPEALALKKELFLRGLLMTTRRGSGFKYVNYVIKRLLPDGSRPFFVVIRHSPKKPHAPGPALLTAAPV